MWISHAKDQLKMKWFISDTHFFHKNIIRYTGRPFGSMEEMDQALINGWNACIDEGGRFLSLINEPIAFLFTELSLA